MFKIKSIIYGCPQDNIPSNFNYHKFYLNLELENFFFTLTSTTCKQILYFIAFYVTIFLHSILFSRLFVGLNHTF